MWKTKFLKWAYSLNAHLKLPDFKIIRGFKRLGERFLFKLFALPNQMLIEIEGMPFYIRSTSNHTYILQNYEPYTTELFKQMIKPKAVVLDIGAQFGYYSLLAAKLVGQEGRIFAFEPVPSNFEVLEKNIQVNGYAHVIHPINKAVGNKHGMITIFLYKDSDAHGMFRHPKTTIREVSSVESITIDEFLEGQAVDVIKMDIEGNEPFALEGMKETITKSNNLILFTEFVPAFLRKAGVQVDDYLRRLEEFGFEVQVIDEQAYCLRPLCDAYIRKGDFFSAVNLYCKKRN